MKEYCENPCCENPGLKEVPVSVRDLSDQVRTLCAPCEEAYTWGVQHGVMSAMGRLTLEQVDRLLEEHGFVVLARNSTDPSPEGEFEAWAYTGALDFQVATACCFGIGRHSIDALRALDHQLRESTATGLPPDRSTPLLVSKRELATMLAALRYHQAENLQGTHDITDEAIRDIATEAGMLQPLSSDEIDELCERLNLGGAAVDWQACEHDWRDIHGPMTGCGVEYWFQCRRCHATKYRCVDQDGSASEETYPPEGDER